jgi:hypothetical protein
MIDAAAGGITNENLTSRVAERRRSGVTGFFGTSDPGSLLARDDGG